MSYYASILVVLSLCFMVYLSLAYATTNFMCKVYRRSVGGHIF